MKKFLVIFTIILILIGLTSCQKTTTDERTITPSSLRDVPALRLNFRFESDVPAPPADSLNAQNQEKNPTIQADFDQNRPEETLEKVIPSPDKKRILVVYTKLNDLAATYRLDMYSADGKLLNKITPNGLAVYYPDTIVWSPDNNNVAFVGAVRMTQTAAPTPTPDAPIVPNLDNDNSAPSVPADSNTNTTPTPDNSKQVLTFRTEQIYTCNSDGGDLKPITQNEGLIYFYFVWSPDSSALATLAATWKEWSFLKYQADQKGENFIPMGRPRLVEKNGRIRLLDDNLTPAHPVWSPDSAKIACAFDKDVRIYDAVGNNPTQAAIPLKVPLLMAAKTFDEELKRKNGGNITVNQNTNSKSNSAANNSNTTSLPTDVNALPDERTLVSFNPIVQLQWTEPNILYLQTGFIKQFKNSEQNISSYLRWHRLLLSPQPIKLN
ncbi:MAG: hypothetical protein K1X72_18840 [Pyrinomonadaceae bacterium]|nr:hypothetical protein [Pyrinomonadaceae bacterium]